MRPVCLALLCSLGAAVLLGALEAFWQAEAPLRHRGYGWETTFIVLEDPYSGSYHVLYNNAYPDRERLEIRFQSALRA